MVLHLVQECSKAARFASLSQPVEGRVGGAASLAFGVVAGELADHALWAFLGSLVLGVEEVRFVARREAERLSFFGEASPFFVGFRFEAREDPRLAHAIGAAENDSKRRPAGCFRPRLSEPLAPGSPLVIHVPDDEHHIQIGGRVSLSQLTREGERIPRHLRAGGSRFAVEMALKKANVFEASPVVVEVVDIEEVPAEAVGYPLSDGFGVRKEDIGDPAWAFFVEDAVDQRAYGPVIGGSFAKEDEPHGAVPVSTQSRSGSRLQSCPAVIDPFI